MYDAPHDPVRSHRDRGFAAPPTTTIVALVAMFVAAIAISFADVHVAFQVGVWTCALVVVSGALAAARR